LRTNDSFNRTQILMSKVKMNTEDMKKLERSFSPDAFKMKEVLSSVTFPENQRDELMFFYQVSAIVGRIIVLTFLALVLRGEILFTNISFSGK
jgi:hypothetical protein